MASAMRGELDPQDLARLVDEVGTSDDLEARALLAEMALRLADYETALERAQTVIDEDPGHIRALRAAGSAALALGESERAVSIFNRLLPLDANRARAFASLAGAYFQMGEYVRASHLYRRSSDEGMPGTSDIRKWHRAEMLNTVDGRPEKVVEAALASSTESPQHLAPWFRLLVDEHPDTPELADTLADAYARTGDAEFALLRAKHLLDLGNWEQAYRTLRETRLEAAHNVTWYRLMRRALQSIPPGQQAPERLEDIAREGTEVAREALEQNPLDAGPYLTLSRMCRDAETPEDGRRFPHTPGKDQALDFAAAALALTSRPLDAELSVIDLLIRQQRYAEAARRAERATAEWPDIPEVWSLASTTRLELGDVRGAAEAATEGLAHHPNHEGCKSALIKAMLAADDSHSAAALAMEIGAGSDIEHKRLRIDASLRVGDVVTALDELATMSLGMIDAPTWLEETSGALRAYERRPSRQGQRLVINVGHDGRSWPSARLASVEDDAEVFVVLGPSDPPDDVLDHMSRHRRPQVGLAFTDWPDVAGGVPPLLREGRVLLASAGDIRTGSAGHRDIHATIEILGRSLKSQFIVVNSRSGTEPREDGSKREP